MLEKMLSPLVNRYRKHRYSVIVTRALNSIPRDLAERIKYQDIRFCDFDKGQDFCNVYMVIDLPGMAMENILYVCIKAYLFNKGGANMLMNVISPDMGIVRTYDYSVQDRHPAVVREKLVNDLIKELRGPNLN